MMRIKTKYFGEIDITEEMIIEFPQGVLGFVDSTKFAVHDIPEAPGFRFLQDIENSCVSFMIVSPWEFFPEYEAVIDAVELESIRKNSVHEADLEVYLIVTIGKNFNQSTANLIAPIVINAADGVGKQFVLHDSKYGTKHLLIPEGSGE